MVMSIAAESQREEGAQGGTVECHAEGLLTRHRWAGRSWAQTRSSQGKAGVS